MTGKANVRRSSEQGMPAARESAGEPRTQSYTRFRPRGQRDGQPMVGADQREERRAPSTLPPPPFETETDVLGHEPWLEAHMRLASTLLCVETAIASMPDDAAHRASVVTERVGAVRDAIYELYCDAADPRMAEMAAPASPLTRHVERVYQWCDRVLDAVSTLTPPNDAVIDRARLAELTEGSVSLFDEVVRDRIRGEAHALGVDFTSPVEPLRNLGRDIEEVFTATTALRETLAG